MGMGKLTRLVARVRLIQLFEPRGVCQSTACTNPFIEWHMVNVHLSAMTQLMSKYLGAYPVDAECGVRFDFAKTAVTCPFMRGNDGRWGWYVLEEDEVYAYGNGRGTLPAKPIPITSNTASELTCDASTRQVKPIHVAYCR